MARLQAEGGDGGGLGAGVEGFLEGLAGGVGDLGGGGLGGTGGLDFALADCRASRNLGSERTFRTVLNGRLVLPRSMSLCALSPL